MVLVTVEAEEVQFCPGCDEIVEKEDAVPLYECSQCGDQYDRDGSADGMGTRCPDCNLFGSRVGEGCMNGCMEPLETGYATESVEGDMVRLPDAEPVGGA